MYLFLCLLCLYGVVTCFRQHHFCVISLWRWWTGFKSRYALNFFSNWTWLNVDWFPKKEPERWKPKQIYHVSEKVLKSWACSHLSQKNETFEGTQSERLKNVDKERSLSNSTLPRYLIILHLQFVQTPTCQRANFLLSARRRITWIPVVDDTGNTHWCLTRSFVLISGFVSLFFSCSAAEIYASYPRRIQSRTSGCSSCGFLVRNVDSGFQGAQDALSCFRLFCESETQPAVICRHTVCDLVRICFEERLQMPWCGKGTMVWVWRCLCRDRSTQARDNAAVWRHLLLRLPWQTDRQDRQHFMWFTSFRIWCGSHRGSTVSLSTINVYFVFFFFQKMVIDKVKWTQGGAWFETGVSVVRTLYQNTLHQKNLGMYNPAWCGKCWIYNGFKKKTNILHWIKE